MLPLFAKRVLSQTSGKVVFFSALWNHVLGFAQLLEMDELSHQQGETVQQILTSGRHLLQLIDRILAVSKSQSDDLSFLETPATQIGLELKRTYV